MSIFELDLRLGEYDTQTNVKIPFEIRNKYSELIIHFSYNPDKSKDDVARRQVEDALRKYDQADFASAKRLAYDHLPIDNLITLSLSKNGKYLGAHHNKSNDQEITINNETASFGFWPVEVEPADWELQLNCHCIASKEVEANIRIEAIK
ncbi:hypothetical protein HW423_03925 [Aerococcaceae bacterium INB8]|uniref:Uncharacterized protein n=1 Tax=Ruoffia halotolerans TaxID=2748684 RepID=A0A839A4T5_9LACT|nr:hypothetical protein [Ruoffia halotolerans]MBA5728931.1 hypothetical protein [Ruoffia halotolerans]